MKFLSSTKSFLTSYEEGAKDIPLDILWVPFMFSTETIFLRTVGFTL